MAFYDDSRIVTEYDKFTTTTYVPLCLFATKYKSVGKAQVKKIIETIAGSDRIIFDFGRVESITHEFARELFARFLDLESEIPYKVCRANNIIENTISVVSVDDFDMESLGVNLDELKAMFRRTMTPQNAKNE